MVDLMKYILSYASNPSLSSERNGLYSKELVELSVRNLLHELGKLSSGPPKMNITASEEQFSGGYGQTSGPIRQNIEMKRGDWICPKYVYCMLHSPIPLVTFHLCSIVWAILQALNVYDCVEMGKNLWQFSYVN